MAEQRRFIVMPTEGFDHPDLRSPMFAPTGEPVVLALHPSMDARPEMRVLDSIGEGGPRLVEMSAEGELSLRLSAPHFKLVPEVFYQKAWYRPPVSRAPGSLAAAGQPAAAPAGAAVPDPTAITVLDGASATPLPGAKVVVFTDFSAKVADSAWSGPDGVARLARVSAGQALDRIYVYGPPGYWGFFEAHTSTAQIPTVRLRRLDPADGQLLLRQLYGSLAATAGEGVTVGIIDSGIDATHPDLPNVAGGLNCVNREVRADPAAAREWGPARVQGEHGTHVAGIVAGRGSPGGFRGVAPAATLRSYRVTPSAGGDASNFDIAKAIDAATADGCDLLNMSLAGGPPDDLVRAAIRRALGAGIVAIAAAGNGNRQNVAYPAAFPECVAVSAMGRRSSFPADSIGPSHVQDPSGGPGGGDFVAEFSNDGPQIDVTGPGVEIVSTLPGATYGVFSGTSMAVPAVTGFAAYLLSGDAATRQARGSDRSQKLKQLLFASCKREGFGREFEGFGLPAD